MAAHGPLTRDAGPRVRGGGEPRNHAQLARRVARLWVSLATLWVCGMASPQRAAARPKEASVFYPATLVQIAWDNVRKYPWAAEVCRRVVAAAQPWMAMSDDELWGLMFGNTIRRSWMVWSNGHCPACKMGVPMYNWQMDALGHPWKTQCPHCKEWFPKNDFAAYYRSGLDEHGVFDPARADRSLLFNVEHPDPADPLHTFGVDDGEGFVMDGKRWRFIGAYLIYGQWKQAVLGGIRNLAAAYVLTGERVYAHKATVLLDRVADLYPTFDFKTQGVMYEGPAHAGYVSTWHDACEETRQLALAYDQVFEGLVGDDELVAFLSEKAARYGLANPKQSIADIRRNIEERILQDAITNAWKIQSNYPRTVVALIVLKSVLRWPENRDEIMSTMDGMIKQATAVDGVTGEKGLAGYAAFTIQGLGQFLAEWTRAQPELLKELYTRHPQLHQTYRFHLDTWCLQQYYPQSGDAGTFAQRVDRYCGVVLNKPGAGGEPLGPSMYTFLWRLYELTGDVAFAQVLYHANGGTVAGLPHDLFLDDAEAVQRGVAEVIAREGAEPRLGSVNKQGWHIALLRSGAGPDGRVAWLDYDAGGGHGHADGMNLGLFAKGLDLMPDLGYPPVHYGGWSGPKFSWYTMPASHNTVVVDGQSQSAGAGKTTLWADGQSFRAIRASAPQLIGGQQYERTIATVDISQQDCYLLDVFRVVGGKEHAKFQHSHYGTITTQGLHLQPAEDYGHGTQMRNFMRDSAPPPGWSVDWQIEDRYHYLVPGAEVHLRYTDLTTDAEAHTAEGWVSVGGFPSYDEAWIPRLMVRRRATEGPLASTFVSVVEPYENASNIASIRRLPLETLGGATYPDSAVAVELVLVDQRRDLFVTPDVENPLGQQPAWSDHRVMVQPAWRLRTDAEACWVRCHADGRVERVAICRGTVLALGDFAVSLKSLTDFVEVAFDGTRATLVSGEAAAVRNITYHGTSVWGL